MPFTRFFALPAIILGLGLFAGGLVLAPTPAHADDSCRTAPVTIGQAIEIARGAGMARVIEVECDDGEWEVEGISANGREMEVEIDARTGRIIDIDYD